MPKIFAVIGEKDSGKTTLVEAMIKEFVQRGLAVGTIKNSCHDIDMDNEGTLIHSYEELGTIATIYNHPYYPKHFEQLGYKKDVDWLEYVMTTPETIPEQIEKIAERIRGQ